MCTSKVQPMPDELQEESLGVVLDTDFCLEEDFVGVWITELIISSIGWVVKDIDIIRSDDDLGASGNTSYNVLDCE